MMKKTTAFVLSLLLCLSVLTFCGSAADTTYIVTKAAGATVYSAASLQAAALTTAKYNSVLTAQASNGEFIRVTYSGYTGWIHIGDVSLYGMSLHVREIVLAALPDKTEYYEDDDFVSDGLKVLAVYNDGSSAEVTGYDIAVPDLYSVGTKTVTVSYRGKTAGFNITVNRLPIDRIEISTPPKSTNIIEDTDKPVLNGMVLTVYYTDGRAPKQVTDYTLSGYDPLLFGQQTATISYKYPDITATIQICVVPKSVTKLTVTQAPKKDFYYDDNLTVDLEGLVLTAEYDNGKSETVEPESYGFRSDPVPNAYHDIVLTYAGFSASYEVRIEKTEVTGISLQPPFKTEYLPGEEPNYDGLVVYLEYSSGNRIGIDDYEAERFDTNTFGKKTVNVYYETHSASFTVNVVSASMLGDINQDEKVNSADARLALRYAARIDSLTDEQIFLGDINKDGKLTSLDARAILRHAAKLELIDA